MKDVEVLVYLTNAEANELFDKGKLMYRGLIRIIPKEKKQ